MEVGRRNLIKVDSVVPPKLSGPSSLPDLLIRAFNYGESVNAQICGQSIGQVLFELLTSGILVLHDYRCEGRPIRLDISIDTQGNRRRRWRKFPELKVGQRRP